MNQRCSARPASGSAGLGAVIIQALESIASRDASEAVVRAALEKAGLRKLPEDPVVLLAFLSGALYQAAAAKLGEEFADAMLADSRPILERAAAHAMALESEPSEDRGLPASEPEPAPEPDAPPEPEPARAPGLPFELDDSFDGQGPSEARVPFVPDAGFELPIGGEPELPFAPDAELERQPPVGGEPELPFVPDAGFEPPDSAERDQGTPLRLGPEHELPFEPEFPLEPDPAAARARGRAITPPEVRGRISAGQDVGLRQTAPGAGQKRRTSPRAGQKRQTSPGVGRKRQTAPGAPQKRRSAAAPVGKRMTSPGVGASALSVASLAPEAAAAAPAGPAAGVRRPSIDPRRLTLGYEAVVDEPTDGQGSRICAVVAMADRTSRAIVARILRREGIGVVTAPDGSLGILLAQRFGAALVVVDAAGAPGTSPTTSSSAGPPVVLLDPDASAGAEPEVSDGCARVPSKPLDPASLVQAIELLLPQGWRR